MTSVDDSDIPSQPGAGVAGEAPNTAAAKDELPPLTTAILTTEEDKTEALKLIADSIAQQRQLAATAILFNPAIVAAYIVLCAVVYKFAYKTPADAGTFVTTWAGVTMGVLVLVRGQTSGYITLAEAFGWNFVRNPDSEDQDIIIGSRYGEEIIGATTLRLERPGGSSSSNRKKTSYKGGKGIIRAWTVRLKYRRAGVGTELLEETVRVAREKCGKDAEIGFAAEHANSTMFLPEYFNTVFRRTEAMAQKCLQKVLDGTETTTKSSAKSSPKRRK